MDEDERYGAVGAKGQGTKVTTYLKTADAEAGV